MHLLIIILFSKLLFLIPIFQFFYCSLILLALALLLHLQNGLVTICLTFHVLCFYCLHAHCTHQKTIMLNYQCTFIGVHFTCALLFTAQNLNPWITWWHDWNKCLMLLCSIENQTRKVPCNLVEWSPVQSTESENLSGELLAFRELPVFPRNLHTEPTKQ